MMLEKSYGSYEEFEREELRKLERLDMSFEEILSDFETIDDRPGRDGRRREGLFDDYDEDDDE
jgi:hypothetical protein